MSSADPAGREVEVGDFGEYFERRASRFAAFYRSEAISRLIGRGPLFDRLRVSVGLVETLGAKSALDVGCGSGPLFAPLVERGVKVTGIDPAPAMIALARREAARHPGMVEVRQRGWESIEEVDAYDVSVALGVFDYVDAPTDLLGNMTRAAPNAIASFPSPGARVLLRKVRYGIHGVHVHGYSRNSLLELAAICNVRADRLVPLGRAGYLVLFSRIS